MITEEQVVKETNASLLVQQAQDLADQPALPAGDPVRLPGGPHPEPKSNATAIQKLLQDLHGAEYDLGKATQFKLQSAIVETVGKLRAIERKHSFPLMAVIVASIAELIRRFKVPYTTIAGLIVEGSAEKAKATLVLNHPESKLPAEVEKEGKNTPDRQFATRYVRLAKWTNARFTGSWPKGDHPVQQVNIMGKDYPTPVDALMDGLSMNCVEVAWARAVGRLHRADMRDKPRADEITAEYAAGFVKSLSVPIRVTDENVTDANGKVIAEKRSSIKVVGNIPATTGTVIALLKAHADLGLKMSAEDVSTIIEIAETLAPDPEPEPTESPEPATQPTE